MACIQLAPVANENLKAKQSLKEIGRGTFGRVFLLKGKTLCVKVPTENDPNGILLRKEAENLLLCKDSRFFVDIHGSGVNRHGLFYIVMVQCESPLNMYCYTNWWINNHQIPINILEDFVRGILYGVDFLHDQGLGHFDLKPENILVDRGEIRIGDLATVHNPDTLKTNGKKIISFCSMDYRAPELMSGRKFGIGADMWSVGCIIFALVAMRNLFTGKTICEIINSMIIGTNNTNLFGKLPDGKDFDPIDIDGNDRISDITGVLQEVDERFFDRGFWWFRFSKAIKESGQESEYKVFGDLVEQCLVGNSSDRLTVQEGIEMLDKNRSSPTGVWEDDEFMFPIEL